MKTIQPEQLDKNVFDLLHKDWCLIAANKGKKYNMMTASWGGFGVLWHKKVATIYIRPQRYTKQFVDESEYFTLNFFPDGYRSNLQLLGTKSGIEMDKEKESGLKGIVENNMVRFEEANLVIKCRKLYRDSIKPELFLDAEIDKNYLQKDYHDMYIGEIVEILVK